MLYKSNIKLKNLYIFMAYWDVTQHIGEIIRVYSKCNLKGLGAEKLLKHKKHFVLLECDSCILNRNAEHSPGKMFNNLFFWYSKQIVIVSEKEEIEAQESNTDHIPYSTQALKFYKSGDSPSYFRGQSNILFCGEAKKWQTIYTLLYN